MLTQLLLWANEQAPAQPAQPEQSPLGSMLLPLMMVLVLFYFLIVLPTQRRDRKQKELLGALKKNDRIVTSTGIIGTVSNVAADSEEVTLKLEEGKMRILRSSIARILSTSEAPQEATADVSNKG